MIIVGTKADLTEKREIRLPLIERMEAAWNVSRLFIAFQNRRATAKPRKTRTNAIVLSHALRTHSAGACTFDLGNVDTDVYISSLATLLRDFREARHRRRRSLRFPHSGDDECTKTRATISTELASTKKLGIKHPLSWRAWKQRKEKVVCDHVKTHYPHEPKSDLSPLEASGPSLSRYVTICNRLCTPSQDKTAPETPLHDGQMIPTELCRLQFPRPPMFPDYRPLCCWTCFYHSTLFGSPSLGISFAELSAVYSSSDRVHHLYRSLHSMHTHASYIRHTYTCNHLDETVGSRTALICNSIHSVFQLYSPPHHYACPLNSLVLLVEPWIN
jgi:hypothetical protein